MPGTGSLSDLQQFLAATYDDANRCYPPSPLCAGSCSSTDPNCNTGGKGTGSYTLTQNTNAPGGTDGTSAALNVEPSATPTAGALPSFDVLYFLKLGPLGSSTHFIYQFNLYTNRPPARCPMRSNSTPSSTSTVWLTTCLPNASSEPGCGANACQWQIWGLNPQTSQLGWIDSGLGCTPLAADTLHQVSWSYSAILPAGANQASQTDYETLTVDGVEMPLNLYEATATSSQPDHLVLQIQQDAHAPLTEWIDAVTFTWSP
ncbi:MAG: hypothetical protein ACLQAT_18155 [Candidatus Binataceae bacterium]